MFCNRIGPNCTFYFLIPSICFCNYLCQFDFGATPTFEPLHDSHSYSYRIHHLFPVLLYRPSTHATTAMVRLREIPRTAAFAWSTGANPFLVTGTRSGAIDADFSDETKLELWDLNLDNQEQGLELQPIASITAESRYYWLANCCAYTYEMGTDDGADSTISRGVPLPKTTPEVLLRAPWKTGRWSCGMLRS